MLMKQLLRRAEIIRRVNNFIYSVNYNIINLVELNFIGSKPSLKARVACC